MTVEGSYSGDPSGSTVDQVRFLVQDTEEGAFLLSDAEIEWLVTKWWPLYDSVTYVASVAAAVISRKYAGLVDVSADGVSVSTSQLATRYRELALDLRQEYNREAGVGGAIDIENLMADFTPDPSIEPLNFGMGVHDNLAAGEQEYGSRIRHKGAHWTREGTVEGW